MIDGDTCLPVPNSIKRQQGATVAVFRTVVSVDNAIEPIAMGDDFPETIITGSQSGIWTILCKSFV